MSAGAFRLDASGTLISPLLAELSWLDHGFGTRHSPVPEGPMATVKQIHSGEVIAAEGRSGLLGEADALVSATPGIRVSVKTADCVSILLADAGKRAVAAVHAGWRGTEKRIVARAIARMTELFGTAPKDVYAAIGPAIGKCCFEVGPEVARQFAFWRPELAGAVEKTHLDLEAANQSQLEAAGVRPDRIDCASLCTVCTNELFFSFRKEREAAGRMISWISVRE